MHQLQGWRVQLVRVNKGSLCVTEPGAGGTRMAAWGTDGRDRNASPGWPLFSRWGSGSRYGFRERRDKKGDHKEPDSRWKLASYEGHQSFR